MTSWLMFHGGRKKRSVFCDGWFSWGDLDDYSCLLGVIEGQVKLQKCQEFPWKMYVINKLNHQNGEGV